jgi:hypothetical protein
MQTSEWTDGDAVMDHRARASNLLPQITQEVKAALSEADIGLDVFLIVPSTGDTVLTFGTVADPPDELWDRVSEIVCSIVRQTVGLRRTRSRPAVCASTGAPASSPVEMPTAIPAPLPVLDAGVDR